MSFKLCAGVYSPGEDKVKSSYSCKGRNISGILSAELILTCAREYIELLPKQVFFFIDLPRQDSEDCYDTYILDCTKKVALALLDHYGDILVNDGPSRFGFGGYPYEDEMMFGEFQEFTAYCDSVKADKLCEMLDRTGAVKQEKADSLRDYMSDEDEGILSPVEADGITVYDLPTLLADAGMYMAE
ncbi:hypothetical protein [Ruminococcus sp.]|uniref:hypothetical protein n=1 Tax=Ruminococcus sp. TaxID=41978 RepID=UPI002583C8CA|nr:hypothetical protein [Ruminococcus sp.]MCR5021883.1 hypothetical protein [Ruminococcus sp.]